MNLKINKIAIRLTISAMLLSYIFSYVPSLMMLSFIFGAIFVDIGYISQKDSSMLGYYIYFLIFEFIFLESADAFFWSFVLGLPCMFLGHTIKNKNIKEYDYLISSIIMALSFIMFYKYFLDTPDINFWEEIKDSVSQTLTNLKDMKQFANTQDMSVDAMVLSIKKISPALVFIYSLIFILLSKYTGVFILKRFLNVKNINVKPFKAYVVPINFAFIFMIFYLICLFIEYTNLYDANYIQLLLDNMIYIVVYLLFLQGFAIIVFSTSKIKSRLLKSLVITTIILFFAYLSVPFIFMAILDVVFDFRKLGFRRVK